MTIQRAFVTVFSEQLEVMRDFYVELFGWRVAFASAWFVHLQAPDLVIPSPADHPRPVARCDHRHPWTGL